MRQSKYFVVFTVKYEGSDMLTFKTIKDARSFIKTKAASDRAHEYTFCLFKGTELAPLTKNKSPEPRSEKEE